MTEYVYIDGNYVENEKATIPIMTLVFLYGTSIFEEIRTYYNSEVKQLQKLYFDVVKGKVPKDKKWCMSIYD